MKKTSVMPAIFMLSAVSGVYAAQATPAKKVKK